jgi:hypothetical protein
MEQPALNLGGRLGSPSVWRRVLFHCGVVVGYPVGLTKYVSKGPGLGFLPGQLAVKVHDANPLFPLLV